MIEPHRFVAPRGLFVVKLTVKIHGAFDSVFSWSQASQSQFVRLVCRCFLRRSLRRLGSGQEAHDKRQRATADPESHPAALQSFLLPRSKARCAPAAAPPPPLPPNGTASGYSLWFSVDIPSDFRRSPSTPGTSSPADGRSCQTD